MIIDSLSIFDNFELFFNPPEREITCAILRKVERIWNSSSLSLSTSTRSENTHRLLSNVRGRVMGALPPLMLPLFDENNLAAALLLA